MTTSRIETSPTAILGKKKSDVAYHSIRRSILLGHLKPGDALLEQGIAERLSCSQGTVREALMRLEHDGLVARRGYRGTMVSHPSVAEASEMARIRIEIECLGVRQSVGSFDANSIESLLGITERMDQATVENDYYRGSELDREFHMAVFNRAGFPALEPILNRCALHVHRFTFMNAEDAKPDKRFGELHRKLVEVIGHGDAEAAVAAFRDHITSVLERFAPILIKKESKAVSEEVA